MLQQLICMIMLGWSGDYLESVLLVWLSELIAHNCTVERDKQLHGCIYLYSYSSFYSALSSQLMLEILTRLSINNSRDRITYGAVYLIALKHLFSLFIFHVPKTLINGFHSFDNILVRFSGVEYLLWFWC